MEIVLGRGTRLFSILRSTSRFPRCFSPVSASYTCCADLGKQKYSDKHRFRVPTCNYLVPCYVPENQRISLPKHGILSANYSNSTQSSSNEPQTPPKKQTVFQKMKQLTKDYWHILIPVHLITSTGWVIILYFSVKNGIDIISILESMNLSEKYLETLRNSSAGNWALTYTLYKIISPVRYTVTVGGTTMAIRYLNKFGYLKAASLKGRIKEKIQSDKSATEYKMKQGKPEVKSEQQSGSSKT